MPALTHFTVTSVDGAYRIAIETDDAAKLEISATFEQLDLIAEELDRVLDEDEETALSEE